MDTTRRAEPRQPPNRAVKQSAEVLRAQYGDGVFREHDLRQVGWLVLERLFFAEMDSSQASAAASVIRALASLGDAPESEEEQLAEIELRGMLMNGFQPRDEEQWALAERLFGERSMEEFRRWQKLPPREPRGEG